MTTAPPQRVYTNAVAELLAHAVDYAGLFPPAALSMDAAAREFDTQRRGPDRWALGRFVVAAGQLDALAAARRALGGAPWPVSVLLTDTKLTVPRYDDLAPLLRVEAFEIKAASVAQIQAAQALVGLAPELYVELPADGDLGTLLSAVKALGAAAKIRTGGVTADAIPAPEAVAHFIVACVHAGVRFKATAGLHHLIRGQYALTYEPGSPHATMFGYLNVFVAAAFAHQGAPLHVVRQVLEEGDLAAFTTSAAGDTLCWRDRCLTPDQARATHAAALVSFGSCSFSEPLAELHAARLVDAA